MKRGSFALIIGMFSLLLDLDPCLAAQPSDQPGDLVEVRYPVDPDASYKERRRTHGANFAVNQLAMSPVDWLTLLNQEAYFDEVYQNPVSLNSVELGYKFNFVLGSLNFLAVYGAGNTSSDGYNLSVTKYAAKGMYIIDNILSEPYVAPYAAASIWQMTFKENDSFSTPSRETSETLGPGFDYSFGLLFQLNWLEPGTARDTLNTTGIQNTYVDIFVTQHTDSQDSIDASTATDFDLGFGLRLEF